MPKYLVTYHDGPPMPQDPEQAQRIVEAFGAWLASAGESIVDPGAPLSIAKTVGPNGVSDGQQAAAISGYSILRATDLDTATELALGHPFIERGGMLEISEVVDVGG